MFSVLVVDDDLDSREAVGVFFAKAGFSVISAENGSRALISLVTAVPDVIILDMRMPELDGIGFLQVIRSYLRWSTIPVIVLTAYSEGDHIEAAIKLGVHQIFRKGESRLAEVLECVRRVLNHDECGKTG